MKKKNVKMIMLAASVSVLAMAGCGNKDAKISTDTKESNITVIDEDSDDEVVQSDESDGFEDAVDVETDLDTTDEKAYKFASVSDGDVTFGFFIFDDPTLKLSGDGYVNGSDDSTRVQNIYFPNELDPHQFRAKQRDIGKDYLDHTDYEPGELTSLHAVKLEGESDDFRLHVSGYDSDFHNFDLEIEPNCNIEDVLGCDGECVISTKTGYFMACDQVLSFQTDYSQSRKAGSMSNCRYYRVYDIFTDEYPADIIESVTLVHDTGSSFEDYDDVNVVFRVEDEVVCGSYSDTTYNFYIESVSETDYDDYNTTVFPKLTFADGTSVIIYSANETN